MKKNKLILSVLAMAFAMSLASCSNENSSNDNNQNNNSGQNSDDNNNNNNNGNNDEEDENPFYRLVLEPNKEFLKSQKSKIQKVNGRTSEVIDYVFSIPEDRIKVSNYNDLLIGEDPFLLTPIAVEVDGENEGKSLTKEETKSLFSPITEFSQSGYGNEGIVKNLYNVSQVNTCYTLSQTKDGAMQSKYYNVSVTIEDNEAPVLNQTSVAELPFTLDVDSIKSSLKTSILSYLTDNNLATTITVTLKDDSILTGLSYLNKEQVIHFDATDSDGNKIENQEFKYKLVDTLNYFENIDQTTVTDISYKSANIDNIMRIFSTYSDIYTYKLLNEDELITNEGTITDELKTAINEEQTAKYAVYEKDALVGEFEYKFKVIDDVKPELYLKGSDELAWDAIDNQVSEQSEPYATSKIETIYWILNWFNSCFEWRDDFGIKNYYFRLQKDEINKDQECFFLARDNNDNLYEYPLNLRTYYYDPSVYHDTYYSKVADGLYDNLGNKIE